MCRGLFFEALAKCILLVRCRRKWMRKLTKQKLCHIFQSSPWKTSYVLESFTLFAPNGKKKKRKQQKKPCNFPCNCTCKNKKNKPSQIVVRLSSSSSLLFLFLTLFLCLVCLHNISSVLCSSFILGPLSSAFILFYFAFFFHFVYFVAAVLYLLQFKYFYVRHEQRREKK